MSPVATDAAFDTRRAIIVGLTAVVLGIGLVFLVTRLAGTGTLDVKLGDDRFQDIGAANLARQIEADGPVLFPDAGTGSRDIIVQHLGTDETTGWLAFNAQRPGQPRDCILVWQADRVLFIDSCDPAITIAADGGDQVSYPAEVDSDGRLNIDLNAAERDDEES
jgi:hypothetical protein